MLEGLVDADLQQANPPSSDTIVELILLGDYQYMTAMLTQAINRNQRGMSVAAISHDSTHPFYNRIKYAFDYANSRRKKAGLLFDKWPIPIPPRSSQPPEIEEKLDRRLVWSLNRREVSAARGVFKQYVRDGMIPFLVGSNGEASKRITVFDPAAEEVIFVPVRTES